MSKRLPGIRAGKQPKMSSHRGRTWDHADLILEDGTVTKGYMDYTWGERFYWEQSGRWYSAPNHYQVPGSYGFDIRPERWSLPPEGQWWKSPDYIRPTE